MQEYQPSREAVDARILSPNFGTMRPHQSLQAVAMAGLQLDYNVAGDPTRQRYARRHCDDNASFCLTCMLFFFHASSPSVDLSKTLSRDVPSTMSMRNKQSYLDKYYDADHSLVESQAPAPFFGFTSKRQLTQPVAGIQDLTYEPKYSVVEKSPPSVPDFGKHLTHQTKLHARDVSPLMSRMNEPSTGERVLNSPPPKFAVQRQ